jgi:predicted unusual protein kinase regulating ubiquinone biosynthesis (AarF/ABC1/UbiB family)
MKSSRVPTSRLERLAQIGWLTGEFAVGGAAEGVRRIFGSATSDASAFLNTGSAERLARRLSRMRGAAMKVGQMISLIDDELLPPEFADALAVLRDAADTMPEAQVRRALAKEYGLSWKTKFREFDFEPIAAASIGQVHAAKTADGVELALKIQYPGIAGSIDSDVDNLATAFKAARILPFELDLTPIVAEVKAQLRQEADYGTEARFLARYRECVAEDPRFAVPEVDDALTTRHILAMTRLQGLPLEDVAGPDHPQERRDETASRLLELVFRELFEFGLMQTDPNFSNYLLLPDQSTIGLLDFGSTRELPASLSTRYAQLFRAVRDSDRGEIQNASIDIGFLRDDDPAERAARFVDLIQLFFESLAQVGPYDFGASNLIARAREIGMELVFRHGYFRPPPAETMFLHRKLDGILMLCARIRARVDVRALLDSVLGGGDGSPRDRRQAGP